MKKTLTINLNKIVFHIDEDAYQLLHAYIEEVGNHFTKNDGKNDIMYDIEARIAELFSEKISTKNSVITIEDVNEVIETMGKPSQYTDEEEQVTEEKSSANNNQKSSQKENRKTYRKLYRDVDNDMVAGVLSGLAKYLGWDVIPLRLAFLFLAFFTSGSFVLVYLIMWIIVPKAVSLSQKMEMRGEDINIDTLNEKSEEFRNASTHKSSFLGSFFRVMAKIFLGFILFIFGVVGISVVGSLLIAALALIFAVPVGLMFGLGDFANELSVVSVPNLTLLTVSSLLIIGMPIFILVYWLKTRKEKEQGSKMTYIISLLLLLAGIFMFFGSGINVISDLDNFDVNYHKTIHISNSENGDEAVEERQVADFHGIKLSGIIPLEIEQVDSGKPKVVVEVTPKYLRDIKTEVKDGILHIYTDLKDKVFKNAFIKVKVATSSLDYLATSGISDVEFKNDFDVKNIQFDISGISSVEAKFNSANKIDVNVSGTSSFDLEGKCDSLLIDASGISNVDISEMQSKTLKTKTTSFLSNIETE